MVLFVFVSLLLLAICLLVVCGLVMEWFRRFSDFGYFIAWLVVVGFELGGLFCLLWFDYEFILVLCGFADWFLVWFGSCLGVVAFG